LTGNRLLYRDGIPIAVLAGGEVQFLETLDANDEWQARKRLLRGASAAPSPAETHRAREKRPALSGA
jgi:ATP-dependent Lhr-like helicase